MNRLTPWRIAGWTLVGILLLLPLLAMQFDTGVNWTVWDFVVAAFLLGGTGVLIEVSVRIKGKVATKAGLILTVLTALLLTWINLAVGVIGHESYPINQSFLWLVLGLALFGGAMRCRPRAMRWLLLATAVTQMSIGVVAVVFGLTEQTSIALKLNGAFAFLWLIAAGLFHYATTEHNSRVTD